MIEQQYSDSSSDTMENKSNVLSSDCTVHYITQMCRIFANGKYVELHALLQSSEMGAFQWHQVWSYVNCFELQGDIICRINICVHFFLMEGHDFIWTWCGKTFHGLIFVICRVPYCYIKLLFEFKCQRKMLSRW